MPSPLPMPDDASSRPGDPSLPGWTEPDDLASRAEAERDALVAVSDLELVRPGLLRGPAERLFLLLLMAAGMTMAWVAHLRGQEALSYLGSFLVTFGSLSLLVRLPVAHLDRKLRIFVAEWVRDLGKGYYSVAALSVFLWWEAVLLLEGVAEILEGSRGVVDGILGALAGFGLESIFNVLMAMAWPLFLLGDLELEGMVLFAGGAWITLRVGSALVSTPVWMLNED